MSRKPVRTYFPQTRLAELAARPGGIARSDAIEGALKSIEGMRADADSTITKSIAAIATVVYSARAGQLTELEIYKVLRLADQIVTLSGTFCYGPLDRVSRKLCDLTDGLIRSRQYLAAPIAVFIQSLQLLSPGIDTLGEAEIEKIEAELAKVLDHFGFQSLAKPGVAEDAEISLGAV
jgi:hypothetical protein